VALRGDLPGPAATGRCCSLGSQAAFRRSELAALDVADHRFTAAECELVDPGRQE